VLVINVTHSVQLRLMVIHIHVLHLPIRVGNGILESGSFLAHGYRCFSFPYMILYSGLLKQQPFTVAGPRRFHTDLPF